MNAAILSLQAQLERERQERQEAEIKRLQYEREHMLRMIMMDRASFDGEESVRFTADSHQCCGSTVHGRLADRATRLAVIVCHPWGPLGGSMHDPTVVSIVSLMTEAGLTTLRFSFRSGIGRGHSSAADLRAACAMLRSLDTPPEALLLVGYSYGSLVVADVAPTLPDVAAFAMVAPPFGFERALFLGRSVSASAQQSAKPKLACIGSDDQFCSPELFEAFSKSLRPPCTSHCVRGEILPCNDHECGHAHREMVDHFSLRMHLDPILRAWLEHTFGCPFEQLAACDGVPVRGDKGLRSVPEGELSDASVVD